MSFAGKVKKAILLYNPASGKRKSAAYADDFRLRWREKYKTKLVVLSSSCAADLREKAAKEYRPGQLLLLMGGDGTFSHALQGISLKNNFCGMKEPIGLLPAGTGNNYLREFGECTYESAVERLFSALDEGRISKSDAGMISSKRVIMGAYPGESGLKNIEKERIFINEAGFGLVPEVSLLAKRLPFHTALSYSLAALFVDLFYKPTRFDIVLDGKKRETYTYFIAISNSKYMGGHMMMAPPVTFNDGRLFYLSAALHSRWSLYRLFPRVFSGTHLSHPEVDSRFIRSFSANSALPFPINIDGEDAFIYNPEIKILPGYFSLYL